jgi:hypothetical protein
VTTSTRVAHEISMRIDCGAGPMMVKERRCSAPTLRRPDKFASMDQGRYGHRTLRNLATLAMERRHAEEARRLWRAVLAECPDDREALERIG